MFLVSVWRPGIARASGSVSHRLPRALPFSDGHQRSRTGFLGRKILRRLLDQTPWTLHCLRRLIGDRVRLTIAACPTCVLAALPTANAVLLDYDLDSGDPCPACFASYGLWSDTSKGIHYAPAIRRLEAPTIVVSCSYPENVSRLVEALRPSSRVARISALEVECELRWIGRLWAWGVL